MGEPTTGPYSAKCNEAQNMRLAKGNKVFLEWWNHWMSRIHTTPATASHRISPDPNAIHPPEGPRNAKTATAVNQRKSGPNPQSSVTTGIPLKEAPY
jgi:hypothetical protein